MTSKQWTITYTHPTCPGIGYINDTNANEIATAFCADDEENAVSLEFMLKAVNNHDALASALHGMVSTLESGGTGVHPIGAARAALAALKS